MGKYYLAIDIGASSGRHIIAEIVNGKIVLEEVYRFWNGMDDVDGSLCWDVDRLFHEIVTGIKKCKEIGKIPSYMGIDTWGVDYVLLDEDDHILGKTYGYRDSRTNGMDEEVYKIIPEKDLYQRTGIQKAIFNTIYQWMAVKKNNPEHMEAAKTMLFIPDYFNFKLTGVKVNEYTEASTGQLLNPKTKDWDYELIDMLGYNKEMLCPITKPGSKVGNFTEEIQKVVGFDCEVILPATHDTGSAVLAVPTNDDNGIYISSGTWSLMGVERMEADCSPASYAHNFTNEGGFQYRFRYLKNIMGLWMIQSVKKELKEEKGIDLSFGELCADAATQTIPSIVNANDSRFLAPKNMTKEVQAACAESGQPVPETPGEIASVIYNSLAKCYADTIEEIQEMTGKTYDSISIVGGGSNAVYLNELTAKYTGRTVFAGPTEATAIGNVMVQMMATGELSDLAAARDCVFDSFAVQTYK